MTLERLEELHDEAVCDQEKLDDNFDLLVDEPVVRWWSDHESNIRSHMIAVAGEQAERMVLFEEDTLLEEHYLRGGPHPYDYKLPLNMWEDIPD